MLNFGDNVIGRASTISRLFADLSCKLGIIHDCKHREQLVKADSIMSCMLGENVILRRRDPFKNAYQIHIVETQVINARRPKIAEAVTDFIQTGYC